MNHRGAMANRTKLHTTSAIAPPTQKSTGTARVATYADKAAPVATMAATMGREMRRICIVLTATAISGTVTTASVASVAYAAAIAPSRGIRKTFNETFATNPRAVARSTTRCRSNTTISGMKTLVTSVAAATQANTCSVGPDASYRPPYKTLKSGVPKIVSTTVMRSPQTTDN